MAENRRVAIMAIPVDNGDSGWTMECSECGPLPVATTDSYLRDQYAHQAEHSARWKAEDETP